MSAWAGFFNLGFQVGRAFLNIASASVQTAKRELGKLAREFVLDPVARRKREEDRAQAEKRQSEIDEEMVSIHERTEREGWTESLRGRFEAFTTGVKGNCL